MAKVTKRRIGMIVAAALVVAFGIAGFAMATTPEPDPVCYNHGDVNGDGEINKDDAIYLLYASFPGLADQFPMTQDGKINGDDVVNKDDAIYLLYASFPGNEQDFPLKGEVHSYYDPTWSWDETAGTAKVTFLCGCGDPHTVDATVEQVSYTAPTCVKAGSKVLAAQVVFEGNTYTPNENKTIVVPATGEHALNEADCNTALKCANCDYEVAAPGHSWELISTDAATCTAQAVEHHKCKTCGETKDVTIEGKVGHTLAYLEGHDTAVEGKKCTFQKQYQCSVCDAVVPGTAEADTYTKHTYVTKLTQEVTCCQNGLKITACSVCDDEKSREELPLDTSLHVWGEGDTSVVGKITFTCQQSGCTATKEEIVADEGKVDTSTLVAGTGVNLDGKASVAMDEKVLEQLENKPIAISVAEKAKSEIEGLTEAQAKQIPTDTVYDFTMTYDDEEKTPITDFSGKVTVTLPYELKTGEDINSIDIWYINNEGKPERVENATYANGFVTFQTDHFSYYTVTLLTPAERCARLGNQHIETTVEKAATCTEEGYQMTVCQRCGAVVSKTVYEKLGHDYDTVTVAATCTTEGLVTETCQREGCGHVVTRKVPALGHDMITDTDSCKTATCFEAGNTVKVCSRNCGYKTETPVAQLSHKYVKSEEKSKAATCSAGGYEIHICSLCDDEITKNEKAPLGHSYPVADAQWEWTEDSTAKVTLVCANDKSHTKVLDAMVTENKDKAQNTTCLGGGSAVYEAVVTYNNVKYTDTHEVTVDAPGHTPGTAWETTDGQHYHLCTVCQEKVDIAAHAWNEGVVSKAPTCVDTGSRTVTCTVCGYAQEQVIAATGAHSYVNGVCSVCQLRESDCDHLLKNKGKLDAAALGLCTGTDVIKYSCDCGENTGYRIRGLGCTFGEPTSESTKDPYGYTVNKQAATCEKCGVVYSMTHFTRMDAEACLQETVNCIALELNGTQVAYQEQVYYSVSHPGVTATGQTLDLKELGACGGSVVYKKCFCGKYTRPQVILECDFEYVFDKDTQEYYDVCTTCGLTWKWENQDLASADPCLALSKEIDTLSIGDKVLAVLEYYSEDESHKMEITKSEPMGTSCTDGIIVTAECADCDVAGRDVIWDHETIRETRTDLSSFNVCPEYLVQSTCLCGEKYADCYLEDTDGSSCQLRHVYDKETGKEYQVCTVCGLQQHESVTQGEKDANCYHLKDVVMTYKNAEGQTLFTGTQRYRSQTHNYRETAQLNEGSASCEDGITVTNTCVDCGYSHNYPASWHYTMPVRSYDLTALGGCIKEIVVLQCPCGEQSRIYWGDIGNSCEFNWVDDDVNNQESYQCSVCGMKETISYSYPENDDPCVNHVRRVYTLSKEGVETTVSFAEDEYVENHEDIYTLTLLDGAADCTGGYKAVATCQTCQRTEDWGTMHYHQTFALSRKDVSGGKLCGPVYEYTNGCACGLYTHTSIQWGENSCEFGDYVHDEALETGKRVCAKCNGYYYTTMRNDLVEGTTCEYRHEQVTHYCDSENNELFTHTYTGTSYQHENAVSFVNQDGSQWTGESCDEGYYRMLVCQKCHASDLDETLRTGCQTWGVGSEVIYDGTGICGPITMYRYSCACGALHHVEVSPNKCQWQNYGYDNETHANLYRCINCDLKWSSKETSEARPEGCITDVTLERTYTLGDKVIAAVSEKQAKVKHLWVHTYNHKPASCEEGWSYTTTCARCGENNGGSGTNNHHESMVTAYYQLNKYGMCGGYLAIQNCACGLNADWNFESGKCQWKLESETNGVSKYVCATCETVCYRTRTGGRNEETCRYEGTERLQFVRGDETVLDITAAQNWVSHTDEQIGISLQDPNGTCEDGVNLTWRCKVCQRISTGTTTVHTTMETDRMETACGTVIQLQSCACGENSYIDRENRCDYSSEVKNTGDSKQGTYTWTTECDDCGLTFTEHQSWSSLGDGCRVYLTRTVTTMCGTKTLTGTQSYETDKHTYGDAVYTLPEGISNCNDGVAVTETCKSCGYKNTWNSYGHSSNKTYFDLADYGAVCGGQLIRYDCACGEYVRMDFAGDNKCKFQQQEITNWITDAVPNSWQYSTDDQQWFGNSAYTFTCAVTEPACGMKLRMAEYWLVEDCVATEYQTWQYFDTAKNDWVDIEVLETGDVSAYHAYKVETVEETQTDGTVVTGTKYTCPDCESYYYSLRYEYTDSTQKHTIEAEDTTGANRVKTLSQVSRYTHIYGDSCYVTSVDRSYTYNDGTEGWYQHTYTYDAADPCSRTRVYTDSENSKQTYKETHFECNRHWETIKAPTCTQFGQEGWKEICDICQTVLDSGTHPRNPNNHNWSGSDETGYTCLTCGQEGENGASDGIILEDLTNAYGNGTSYVIGYWNKGEAEFVNSVCIVLPDGSTEYLEGIDFTDRTDVVAVSFDKAQADQLAATAANGAVYQLRVNFVSGGAEYAITLDAAAE